MHSTGTARPLTREKTDTKTGEKDKTSWRHMLLMAPAVILGRTITEYPLFLPVLFLIALLIVK